MAGAVIVAALLFTGIVFALFLMGSAWTWPVEKMNYHVIHQFSLVIVVLEGSVWAVKLYGFSIERFLIASAILLVSGVGVIRVLTAAEHEIKKNYLLTGILAINSLLAHTAGEIFCRC